MELSGYSGCELKIIDNNGIKVVQKNSSTIEYNERLIKQKEKQNSLLLGDLNNCKVYDDGFDDGIYHFTMEYINGQTLSDWIERAELLSINNIVDKLTSYYLDINEDNFSAERVFSKKVITTKNDALKNHIIKVHYYAFEKAFDLLQSYSWLHVIESPCHGDMTLENILVDNGNFYLIDFLDSFYDTWMIDAAKLLQDTECYWSYRKKYVSVNLKVRLLIFRDLLKRKIYVMEEGEVILDTIYHILLLNLLRILPYVKDEFDCAFLSNEISIILSKIERKTL